MELSQAQEIADLIQRFKDSGKWTAAYVETAGEMSPGNLPYLVAAATGDISLMPEGELDLVGVGMRENLRARDPGLGRREAQLRFVRKI